jgi:RNA polymerase sigma-70 factor (ECF subfamily)
MNDIVWLEFEKKLRAYVRRRVSANAVDDVVSDILLRLFRSRDKMEGAKNPLAWIYRVAANAITDHYRKSASEKRMLDEMKLVTPERNSSDAAASDPGSLANCMVPMIRNLPPPYDQALMLTEIEGVSQVAAAKELGISVSGMKSRVQRGRQKLKASLLSCCTVEVNGRGSVVDFQMRDATADSGN